MLFLFALISTVVCLIYLVTSPFRGLLLLFTLRPVIDVSWKYSLGGFNLLDVVGVAVPLLFLPRILTEKSFLLNNQRWKYLAIGYLMCNSLGFVFLLLDHQYLQFANLLLRSLNGFLGFFLLAFYFDDREKFRYLLIALLIAGIFPILMGMYQKATGIVWQERRTIDLVRSVGLYHGAFNFRFYGFQTIAAILLYLSYFKPSKRWLIGALIAYMLCCSYVIFNVYSKSAIVIACLWICIWTVINRKIRYTFLIVVAILGINLASNNIIFERIGTVFSKEIMFKKGEIEDPKRMLAGRGFIWEKNWQRWKKLDPEMKIFGTGQSPAVHNEFFRILFVSGFIGFMTYIFLMMIIGWMLLSRLRLQCTPINILALMLFFMWLVDCIGLHPGLYVAYQWFILGMIGLSVTGIKGLDGNQRVKQPRVGMLITTNGSTVKRYVRPCRQGQ